MRELTLTVLGKTFVSGRPRFRFVRPSDDPDADTRIESCIGRIWVTLAGRFRILDGRRTNCLSRRESCIRRTGDEDSGKQPRWQGWYQPQIVDLVEFSRKADGMPVIQQMLNDERVFGQPLVSLVVGCCVVQCYQIVLEAACDHVQIDSSSINMA